MRGPLLVALLCLVGPTMGNSMMEEELPEVKIEEGNKAGPADQALEIPASICLLPDYTGGTTMLLEDCTTLDQLKSPPVILNYRGSSVEVCCPPKPLSADELESYSYEYDGNYDYVIGNSDELPEYDYSYAPVAPSPVDKCWFAPNTTCTEFDECLTEDFNGEVPPITCGYNSKAKVHKFCCKKKEENENEGRERTKLVKIRHGKGRQTNYECEDFVPDCSRWAQDEPESCTNDTKSAFPFMTLACQKSCSFCGEKGCVDEFAKCSDWSRFYCVKNPPFMGNYCRASCGTCGFYGPRNTENQVVNDRSYTYIKDSRFFCGAGLSLKEVRERTLADSKSNIKIGEGGEVHKLSVERKRRKREATPEEEDYQQKLDLFDYKTDYDKGRRFHCGSVLINDRFAILAAHCLLESGTLESKGTPTILIRDSTPHIAQYAVRRYFSHPDFHAPHLYSDIAIAELSHRIDYDFDNYGDTPACLGKPDSDLKNTPATTEGYGQTETGEFSNSLLYTNVTIIDNKDCSTYLRTNTTRNPVLRKKLNRALRFGINSELLCSVGHFNATLGVYSGPCEGDSGGPLYVNYGSADVGPERKETVEGIVSGGLGCGAKTPSWYTRVSSYLDWIECVIREVGLGRNREAIETSCATRSRFPAENFISVF